MSNVLGLFLDNTAPTVVIKSTTDLQTATPTIQWTSSEDVNFKCSLDGGRFFYCGNGTTGSWTGTNLIDGRHKFVIQAEDPVRNTGTLTFTWNKGKDVKTLDSVLDRLHN
jgi:hypothetical protein